MQALGSSLTLRKEPSPPGLRPRRLLPSLEKLLLRRRPNTWEKTPIGAGAAGSPHSAPGRAMFRPLAALGDNPGACEREWVRDTAVEEVHVVGAPPM